MHEMDSTWKRIILENSIRSQRSMIKNFHDAVDEENGFIFRKRRYFENPNLHEKDRRLMLDTKLNVPFFGSIVKPKESDEVVTSLYTFYKRNGYTTEKGEFISYFDHIFKKITGWSTLSKLDDTQIVNDYFHEFRRPEQIISYGYYMLGKYYHIEPKALYRGWYEPNPDGSENYIKLDITQGSKYIFSYFENDGKYEGWFLRDIIRPGNPRIIPSYKLTALNLITNNVSSKKRFYAYPTRFYQCTKPLRNRIVPIDFYSS
jgi:hypothetical protein